MGYGTDGDDVLLMEVRRNSSSDTSYAQESPWWPGITVIPGHAKFRLTNSDVPP